jgi:excisionase family DNA binding protein
MTAPVMLDETDLRNCRVGLHWIQCYLELNREPPHPAFARALNALDKALASSANGTEPPAEEDDWLTTAQVAERLGCSTRYVRRRAAELGGIKAGRDWRFPP